MATWIYLNEKIQMLKLLDIKYNSFKETKMSLLTSCKCVWAYTQSGCWLSIYGLLYFALNSDPFTLTLLPVWRRRLDIGEVLWLFLRRYSGL